MEMLAELLVVIRKDPLGSCRGDIVLSEAQSMRNTAYSGKQTL